MPEVPFSKRHGYAPRKEGITVYDTAPPTFRDFVIYAAHQHLSYLSMDVSVCDVLNLPSGKRYISEGHCESNVRRMIHNAPWFRVYDIIERFWSEICEKRDGKANAEKFGRKLNDFFEEHGYGWQLVNGKILTRGNEAFERAVKTARAELEEAARPTAARRIHEALQDLSGRPEADYAGAISHAISALECVAGNIAGNATGTLGDLLKVPDLFPGSLRKTVEGVWAYANNEGARHGKEGKEPEREEAELIVGLAAVVATYLNRKSR